MASILTKKSLSEDISITKMCFVAKFYQVSLFIKTYLLVVGIALKIKFVVFVYKLISYEIIFLLLAWLCNYFYCTELINE